MTIKTHRGKHTNTHTKTQSHKVRRTDTNTVRHIGIGRQTKMHTGKSAHTYTIRQKTHNVRQTGTQTTS